MRRLGTWNGFMGLFGWLTGYTDFTVLQTDNPSNVTLSIPNVVTYFDAPSNDACTVPEALPLSGAVVQGSTVNATDDFGLGSPDVFYTVEGNGRILKVSTCDDATTLATAMGVQNGGCSQSFLAQVTTDPDCASNVNAAAFQWDSVAGTSYSVVIYSRQSNAEGDFGISAVDFPNPENDYCAVPEPIPVNGDVLSGTTVNATSEFQLGAPEVFYSIVGNGRIMKVSTCDDETTFPTTVGVQNGGCTTSFIDRVSVDPDCPDNVNAAAVTWDSIAGTTYSISVYGSQSNAMGDFAIFGMDFVNPDNDYCAQGQAIPTTGAPVAGSTVNATSEFLLGSPEVFYTIVGTGNNITVTTCADETVFETSLSIQNGGCGSSILARVNSDPDCPENVNAAAHTWETVEGQTYSIAVLGRQDGEVGDFVISAGETDVSTPSTTPGSPTEPTAPASAPSSPTLSPATATAAPANIAPTPSAPVNAAPTGVTPTTAPANVAPTAQTTAPANAGAPTSAPANAAPTSPSASTPSNPTAPSAPATPSAPVNAAPVASSPVTQPATAPASVAPTAQTTVPVNTGAPTSAPANAGPASPSVSTPSSPAAPNSPVTPSAPVDAAPTALSPATQPANVAPVSPSSPVERVPTVASPTSAPAGSPSLPPIAPFAPIASPVVSPSAESSATPTSLPQPSAPTQPIPPIVAPILPPINPIAPAAPLSAPSSPHSVAPSLITITPSVAPSCEPTTPDVKPHPRPSHAPQHKPSKPSKPHQNIFVRVVGNNGTPRSKFPLGHCEGDCDTDNDCKPGLQCFHRNKGDGTDVPGCRGGSHGMSRTDYCYDLTLADSNGGSGGGSNSLVVKGQCSRNNRCHRCEGDCDDDGDCASDLICYHRDRGEGSEVPGCSGGSDDMSRTDYCVAR